MPRFVALLLLIAVIPAASAQPAAIDLRYQYADLESPELQLSETVLSAFKSALELRGIEIGKSNARWRVFARPVYSGDTELIVLTIVEGSLMPPLLIDAAAERELWYVGRTLPENVEEGAFVRRMMTREFMESYTDIHGIRILTIAPGEMDRQISTYVDSWIQRYSCPPDGECS